jgi:TrmH family RNA methyltransferase
METIEKITSRENRRLVHARKVRDGRERRQIFIEGRRLVGEALRSDLSLAECFITESFGDAELLDAVMKMAVSVAELPDDIFSSVAETAHSQGIILIAERPEVLILTLESRLGKSASPIILYLHEVNNPSNLGAAMRTAEAGGVAGVIISAGSADAYSPKALRSAMGASFRLPIWEGPGFEEVCRWVKTQKLTTTAADISADTNYLEADWKTARLLVFGSEAHGLTPAIIERIEEKVFIPMENEVESLNLAVSVGVILFEAKRQNAVS